jgi:hypothetical protein
MIFTFLYVEEFELYTSTNSCSFDIFLTSDSTLCMNFALLISEASHFNLIKNVAFTGGPGGSSSKEIFISGYFSSKYSLKGSLKSIVIFSELSLDFQVFSSYLSGDNKFTLTLI